MFGMMRDLINYTGSQISNVDQYSLYASIVMIVIGFVFFMDLLYRLLRSFTKK